MMVPNIWANSIRIVQSFGLFLLLFLNATLTEDIEHIEVSEDVKYSISSEKPEFKHEDGFGKVNRKIGSNDSFSEQQIIDFKTRTKVRSLLIRYAIIPDVLAIPPTCMLEVMFSLRCKIKIGDKFDPVKLQKPPRKLSWPWSKDEFYTLVLVDADVPSRRNRSLSQRLHWLVVNIPEHHLDRGDQVVDYIGPIAPSKTGLHRYIFAVFKQPDHSKYEGKRITSSADKLSPDRLNFSIRDFSSKYKLRNPIAVNFYLTGWPLDQFIPEVTRTPKRPRF